MNKAAAGRILVVDDSRDYCELQRHILTSAGYDVAIAANDDDALRAFSEFAPDLVLLDLRFARGTDGLTIARRIRDQASVPIVFVSGSDRAEERLAAFDIGADDFVHKEMSRDELLSRIRAVLRRSVAARPEILRVGDLVIDESAHLARRGGHQLDLTPREFALLVTLARQRGRVLSKEHLLGEVWGFEGYDSNVVEVHVSALRRKLEAAGPRVVHTVRGIGYVFQAEQPAASAMRRRATD